MPVDESTMEAEEADRFALQSTLGVLEETLVDDPDSDLKMKNKEIVTGLGN